MNRVVRLPSKDESERAEKASKTAWFPQVGSWWKNDKGKVFFKLGLMPDVVFMLQVPKEDRDIDEDQGPF